MIEQSKFYIGGRWVRPRGHEVFEVVNPSDESIVGTAPIATAADIDDAVAVARESFEEGTWRQTPVSERIEIIERFGSLIGERSAELIDLIIKEMGAPIGGTGAAGQVLGVPVVVGTMASVAKTFPWFTERVAPEGDRSSLVVHEPVGVVGAIIPWNGPLFLAAMKMAPALISGCSFVLKPAPETALDSYIFAEIAEKAGIPPGVLSIVPGGREAGESLVNHPEVDKITFTGSTSAGRQIGIACASQFKRVALELGGKSAAIILDDVDIESVIPSLVAGGLGNNGQQCFALSRILVSSKRKKELVDVLGETFAKIKVGHALDPETELGPLITNKHRESVEAYIEKGKSEGAQLVVGGSRPDGLDKGWYLEPTLFSDVDNNSTIAQEEIFGPVISVIEYGDERDAIAKANHSVYGLSGAVFTSDADHGVEIARQVRTGTFHVQHFGGNLAAPFGGFKASGIGREWGIEGLSDFTEMKSIHLGPGVPIPKAYL